MKIKLNEQYQVRGIPMNFILEEKKINKKTNEEYWETAGYYANLESLLLGIATHGVQTTETEGIELLIREIKMLCRDVLAKITLLQDEGEGEGKNDGV
jgi:hypothetical protein